MIDRQVTWILLLWPFYVQQMKYKQLKHMALVVDVFSNYRVLDKSTSQWHRLSTDNMNTLQFGATSCAWENKNFDDAVASCNSKQREKTMLGWLLLRRKQTRLVHLYENISKYGIYLFVSTNCFIIVIRVCFQLWILFFLSTKVHKSIETAVGCFV